MKKNIKNYLIIMILLIFLSSIVLNSNEIINSSLLALDIWKKNIFPSLFPMFIISDLLINYNFINILGNIFYKPLNKLFHFNKAQIFIFFISILSGFPSSGKYSSYLYNKKLINKKEANRMLMCSHFSNPLFIFGTIYSLINDKKICMLILISHYLGNIIIALFTKDNVNNSKEISNINDKFSFSDCLTNSITNNTNTLIFILGTITFFLITTTIINKLFSFNKITSILICGLFEMTQGIKMISINNLSKILTATLITFFISFGGISVHLQTIGMIKNSDLNYKYFLEGRIIHSIISSTIIYFILIIFYIKGNLIFN